MTRSLTLLDLVCIGLNTIVGSSIFLFPGVLSAMLGPASILAFGLVGLLMITVGLCYAEASSHFESTGGAYLYARHAFGEWTGFSIGWMSWAVQVLSWAAVADAIAVYMAHFDPRFSEPLFVKLTAAAAVLALAYVNARGVKMAAWVSDFFTAAKLVPLAIFLLLGLRHLKPSLYHPFAPKGWAPIGQAAFLTYFAFQGFESIPVPSGEVESPKRNVPLAVIISLVFASLLYMAVQAVAVGLHPDLGRSAAPLADAGRLAMGAWGGWILALGAVLSTTGYNAGSALVTPRYLLALSEDRHIPGWIARLDPKRGTPARAIWLTSGLTLALAVGLDFRKLVDFSNVVVCAQYFSTCLAVPFLRRKNALSPGSLRLPGGLLIPVLGACATLWLGVQAGRRETLGSLAILAAGLLAKAAYGVWQGAKGASLAVKSEK